MVVILTPIVLMVVGIPGLSKVQVCQVSWSAPNGDAAVLHPSVDRFWLPSRKPMPDWKKVRTWTATLRKFFSKHLVGGFNPFEKY